MTLFWLGVLAGLIVGGLGGVLATLYWLAPPEVDWEEGSDLTPFRR